jgi:hypothetical protein
MFVDFIFFTYLTVAIHNKDYSVVKTFKAAQVAFFFYILVIASYNQGH